MASTAGSTGTSAGPTTGPTTTPITGTGTGTGTGTRAGNPNKRSRQAPGPACQQCRMRKLRCDRKVPCGTCKDSDVACQVDPTAPQRGPKRGHLKVLRSRIAALEQSLGKHDGQVRAITSPSDELETLNLHIDTDGFETESQPVFSAGLDGNISTIDMTDMIHPDLELDLVGVQNPTPLTESALAMSQLQKIDDRNMTGNHERYFDLEGTTAGQDTAGLLSPLTRADLDQLYFDRVHAFVPFVHRCRHIRASKPSLSWTPSPSHACLQHAMWAMAASLSSQFQHLRDMLYREALERLKVLELSSHPAEDDASRLEQAQAWMLIAVYELMRVGFHRAWASAGRAIRLVQLMRLNEIDVDAGAGGAYDACEQPGAATMAQDPEAFVVIESKRRTFWMALCIDRCCCVLDELPLTLSEQGISTRLPCPEENFQSGTPITMPFLAEATASGNPCKLSPFVECIVFTMLWGKILAHKQSTTEHVYGNVFTDFCQRQLWLDGVLTRCMGELQRNYPEASIRVDSTLLIAGMVAQSALLLLCKAAESIPQTATEYSDLLQGFHRRAPTAVKEIARLSKYLAHFSVFNVHPFTPISLLLCQQSLMTLRNHEASLEEDLNTITEALNELKTVNGLCKGTRAADFFDPQPPDSFFGLDEPGSVMALLG